MISKVSTELVSSTSIGNIHISDHAPITIEISITKLHKYQHSWQCNRSILSDPEFYRMAKIKLVEFLEINDNGETDSSNLWETTKAYLRGMMISYCAARQKKIIKEQRRLELKLQGAESEHKLTLSKESWDKVLIA